MYIGKSDETPPKKLSTDSQTTVDWFYPHIGLDIHTTIIYMFTG